MAYLHEPTAVPIHRRIVTLDGIQVLGEYRLEMTDDRGTLSQADAVPVEVSVSLGLLGGKPVAFLSRVK